MNTHTFVIKSQRMIDWAIDGVMEAQDAGVFNILQDAKTEFHDQLFTSEHRSYYNAQDVEILDERRTAANVGWLHGLVGTSPSKKRRPPTIPDPQEQPGRDRHLGGVHGRLHADQVHPGAQRVRHMAVVQA
ncbi:MAG: hypothetical protein ACKPKO_07310, partial [Candidatus Fonsibacter sp.]